MGTIVAVPPVRARFLRVEPHFARTQGHRHEQCGGWGLFPCLDGDLGFTTGAVPFVITAGQVRSTLYVQVQTQWAGVTVHGGQLGTRTR